MAFESSGYTNLNNSPPIREIKVGESWTPFGIQPSPIVDGINDYKTLAKAALETKEVSQ